MEFAVLATEPGFLRAFDNGVQRWNTNAFSGRAYALVAGELGAVADVVLHLSCAVIRGVGWLLLMAGESARYLWQGGQPPFSARKDILEAAKTNCAVVTYTAIFFAVNLVAFLVDPQSSIDVYDCLLGDLKEQLKKDVSECIAACGPKEHISEKSLAKFFKKQIQRCEQEGKQALPTDFQSGKKFADELSKCLVREIDMSRMVAVLSKYVEIEDQEELAGKLKENWQMYKLWYNL